MSIIVDPNDNTDDDAHAAALFTVLLAPPTLPFLPRRWHFSPPLMLTHDWASGSMSPVGEMLALYFYYGVMSRVKRYRMETPQEVSPPPVVSPGLINRFSCVFWVPASDSSIKQLTCSAFACQMAGKDFVFCAPKHATISVLRYRQRA